MSWTAASAAAAGAAAGAMETAACCELASSACGWQTFALRSSQAWSPTNCARRAHHSALAVRGEEFLVIVVVKFSQICFDGFGSCAGSNQRLSWCNPTAPALAPTPPLNPPPATRARILRHCLPEVVAAGGSGSSMNFPRAAGRERKVGRSLSCAHCDGVELCGSQHRRRGGGADRSCTCGQLTSPASAGRLG